MANYSGQLRDAIQKQLGYESVVIVRAYHAHARHMGDWVYSWLFRHKDYIGWIGCYDTMKEVVSAINNGATLILNKEPGTSDYYLSVKGVK